MSITRLERQASALVNTDARPRPTTKDIIFVSSMGTYLDAFRTFLNGKTEESLHTDIDVGKDDNLLKSKAKTLQARPPFSVHLH